MSETVSDTEGLAESTRANSAKHLSASEVTDVHVILTWVPVGVEISISTSISTHYY